MFLNGFNDEIKVYRKSGGPELTQWGERSMVNEVPEIPFLVGYAYSHSLMGTVAGRATDEIAKTPEHARLNNSAMTLYCDVDEDIRSEDVISFLNHAGRTQVFQVQGETDMDYVSPYSGFVGGKEVFIQRYTKARA